MGSRRSRREATGAFDDVITDLYDALLQPEAWPAVLARVADAAGLDGMHFMFVGDKGYPFRSEISTQLRLDDHERYCRYYIALDPRRRLLETLPVGKLMLCHDTFDEDFVRRSAFYNEFYIPSGLRYCAAVRPFREGGQDAMFAFIKNVGRDPFDDREVRRLRTLLPHLRRVAQVQHRLAALEGSISALSSALDRLASGVVIVDQGLRVRSTNRAAEALVRAGDGIQLRNHRLIASHTEAARTLDRLIAEAAQCAAGGDPHKGGGALALPRSDGRQPLLVVVAPLPAYSAACLWWAEPAVAVFITDPQARPQAPAECLADLFGLTPAEARLAAALAAGDSLADTAGKFGLSKHTVRVQLQALMAKTGTNRQAALVRLLTTIAGH
jgi:DNA-binding CsgD family transcriptional regulator